MARMTEERRERIEATLKRLLPKGRGKIHVFVMKNTASGRQVRALVCSQGDILDLTLPISAYLDYRYSKSTGNMFVDGHGFNVALDVASGLSTKLYGTGRDLKYANVG